LLSLRQRIMTLTEHFKIHKKDNHGRRGLLKMVALRRKLLDYKGKDEAGAGPRKAFGHPPPLNLCSSADVSYHSLSSVFRSIQCHRHATLFFVLGSPEDGVFLGHSPVAGRNLLRSRTVIWVKSRPLVLYPVPFLLAGALGLGSDLAPLNVIGALGAAADRVSFGMPWENLRRDAYRF
jgi:hypothetical protein